MKRVDGALSHNLRSKARPFRPLLHALLCVATVAAIAQSASAAPCSDPDGVEGELVYNTTYKVVQFCNGTLWIGMGGLNDIGSDNDTLAALGCLNDQVPKWSGSNWTCAVDDAGGVPAGTVAGAVQFRGASAVFAADDINLVWDDTNNQLGIGTSTPSAILHTKAGGELLRLESTAARGSGNAFLQFNDPTGIKGFYGYTGSDDSLRMWNLLNAALVFATNGGERMRINPDGNVGIGTTSPGYKLHVEGSLDADAITINGNPVGTSSSSYWNNVGDGRIYYSSNNVGIGTASPQRALHVTQSTATPNTLIALENPDLTNGSGTVVSYRTTTTGTGAATFVEMSGMTTATMDHNHATRSSTLSLFTTSNGSLAHRLLIADNGNVGIGTTTPGYLLHLRSTHPYIGFQDTEDPNGSVGSITQFQDGTMFYDADVNNTATPGQHIFRTDGASTKMIISNSGNVGIGTTASPVARLHVASIMPLVRLQDNDSAGAAAAGYVDFVDSTGARTGYIGDAGSDAHIYLTSENGWVRIYSGANNCSYSGGASWTCSSDARLKKEVQPLSSTLDDLILLDGVAFRWIDANDGGGRHFGLIAQDVEKVYPELVTTDEAGMKGVDYSGFIAPLLEAVKELKAANDNQAEAIDQLREELKALKSAR